MTSKHLAPLPRRFLEDHSRRVLVISKHLTSMERKLIDSCEKTSQDYSSTVLLELLGKGAGKSMQDFFM